MPGVTFEDFGKDLDAIPNVIGSDSPAKSKPAAKKKPKPAPKVSSQGKKERPITIRFSDDQLNAIIAKIDNKHVTLRPLLRDIILEHFGIS